MPRLRHLLFLLLVFPALADAVMTPEIQRRFERLYADYAKAVRAMDSKSYMAFFAADFAMRTPDGKVHDRAEMAHYQEINAKTTSKVNAYSVTIEAITPLANGDVAVIVLQQYDRDQAPLEEPDKPHRIKTSAVQRETWRPDGKRWKISTIEEILVGPVSIDGKVQQQ